MGIVGGDSRGLLMRVVRRDGDGRLLMRVMRGDGHLWVVW